MALLITGGTGFIGSHTAVELLDEGYEIVIIDNLSNSKQDVVDRISEITGKQVKFYQVDLLDRDRLSEVFQRHRFTSVIHFAASKVLAQSLADPLSYYRNNVEGTLNLLETMEEYQVKQLVFSSTAAVYAASEESPLNEESSCSAGTPYGRTKLFCEEIIRDVHNSGKGLSAAILRYFNPLGAHSSGLIGEEPNLNPDNLLPYVARAAAGELEYVTVYGDDYPTKDGSGVRDFIHVVDLAKGHLQALKKLQQSPGIYTYNLGCGCGHSVFDVIRAYEKASGREIPYRISGRRAGDLAEVFADSSKAEAELNWKAKMTLSDMCRDSWTWKQNSLNNVECRI